MVYLHENREEFTNAVNLASEYFHILPIIAEKDYYVTMILRELSERQDFIVFKSRGDGRYCGRTEEAGRIRGKLSVSGVCEIRGDK